MHFYSIVLWALFCFGAAQSTRRGATYITPKTNKWTPKTLNRGNALRTGKISDYFRWQASGALKAGGCRNVASQLDSATCYTMELKSQGQYAKRSGEQETLVETNHTLAAMLANEEDESDPIGLFEEHGHEEPLDPELVIVGEDDYDSWLQEEDSVRYSKNPINPFGNGTGELHTSKVVEADSGQPSPWAKHDKVFRKRGTARQRDEIFSWPPAPSGQTWRYSWSSYFKGTPKSTEYFFHLWQLLCRANGFKPVMSLHLYKGKVIVSDYYRGCRSCSTAKINDFASKSIDHVLEVRYGGSGYIKYRANNSAGKTILRYYGKGYTGENGSIKIGPYRRIVDGLQHVQTTLSDFTAKRLR